MRRGLSLAALASLMLGVLASCATPPTVRSESETNEAAEQERPYCDEELYKQDMDAIRVEIEREIGDPLASRVEWCRVLGLAGERLVFSTWRSDEVKVEALGAVYRDVFAEYEYACLEPDRIGRPPAIPNPPTLALVNGRCIIE